MSEHKGARNGARPLLGPPPRRIPWTLRLECLFGGSSWLGWTGLLFGLLALEAAAEGAMTNRAREAGAFLLWGVPLTALGAVLVRRSVGRGREALRLMAQGKLAPGRLADLQSLQWGAFVVTLHYPDEGGVAREMTFRTRNRRLLDRDRLFGVLYDPLDPARAVVLDGLPSAPQTDGEGGLRGPPISDIFYELKLVFLTVSLHTAFLIATAVRFAAWLGR